MRKTILALAIAALALGTSCNKLQSRDHLNKGVQAFTAAQYPEAVEHFKTAVELDPNFPTARLYLATAYMQQYIPGADSPENMKMASEAFNQFQKVLEQDPKDSVAIASIASLNLNQKKWDEAQQWFDKLIAVEPNNADAYYSMGFIAWSKWYPAYGTARANLGMKQEDPGPIKDKKVKEELKQKWTPVIDAGLASFTGGCAGLAPGAAWYFDGHLAAMVFAWKVPSTPSLPSAIACALSRNVSGSGSFPM